MTRRRTIRTVLLARLPQRDDDRGSIPFLILVMIVAATLGGVLMATIIDQTGTTRFNQSRVRSLTAAQSGIDYVLGQIRTAVTTTTNATTGAVTADPTSGDSDRLPCGPWNNISADDAGATSFTVTLTYFTANPVALTDTARSSNKLACSKDHGPFDLAANLRTPKYAVITSTGVDNSVSGSRTSRGRTLETTYALKTTDAPPVQISPGGASNLCLDAGPSVSVGTLLTFQTCSAANGQQTFTVRTDGSIALSSPGAQYPQGLCLNGSLSSSASITPGSSAGVSLSACGVVGAAVSVSLSPFCVQVSVSLLSFLGLNLAIGSCSSPGPTTYTATSIPRLINTHEVPTAGS